MFDLYRYNREVLNPGHNEFKMENLKEFFPDIHAEIKITEWLNTPELPGVPQEIDPSKVPVPETPVIDPPSGPSPLPMPNDEPPLPDHFDPPPGSEG